MKGDCAVALQAYIGVVPAVQRVQYMPSALIVFYSILVPVIADGHFAALIYRPRVPYLDASKVGSLSRPRSVESRLISRCKDEEYTGWKFDGDDPFPLSFIPGPTEDRYTTIWAIHFSGQVASRCWEHIMHQTRCTASDTPATMEINKHERRRAMYLVGNQT
ncbi:hypothetical protein PLICRDRAFT_42560 [Plicaturopsis crispa FD-325 SS-3]|nr:hypothetical protein PLICRDRAFT_42560 [Plicaturopsis crispa FD-325 SS-3]